MKSSVLFEVCLFGKLQVKFAEQIVARFQTRKTGALLGLIAMHTQRQHRREDVIEMLWPDADLDSGRNRLRLALSDLRRLLERQTAGTTSAPRLIHADRYHVSLNEEFFTTDKRRFETLLEQARLAEHDQQRIVYLSDAIALYRDVLLSEFDDLWIMVERLQLADAYHLAVHNMVKALVKADQFDLALSYAQRAFEKDRLREESHRTLIKLYIAMGRPADAMHQYRTMETLMRDELGVTPSISSRQLFHKILATYGPEAPSLPSVFAQTVRPVSLDAAATLPQNSISRPHFRENSTLPSYGTPFVGRHQEIAQLYEMLQVPYKRLVTITGIGGIGKTRLAIEVGQHLGSVYGEHIYYVPLSTVQRASQIVEEVASTLHLPDLATISRSQQIKDRLNGRSALLILDNCEHLGNDIGFWIADLLQASPTTTCLATSRQRLNISYEYEYSLHPLPLPARSAKCEQILACPSVQLFVERARQVRPDFSVDACNASTVADLCIGLDGLPLAIELAAARTQTLSIAQIQMRLKQRFTLLVSRHHDIPTRHRSLATVLESSFELLSPSVQRFVIGLSVFQGGWTLEAAEAVCQEEQALEYLTLLCEHSLISTREVAAQQRFEWLETIREYAATKLSQNLSEEEATTLRTRHAQFYAALRATSQNDLTGDEAVTTLARLEAERANCALALEA